MQARRGYLVKKDYRNSILQHPPHSPTTPLPFLRLQKYHTPTPPTLPYTPSPLSLDTPNPYSNTPTLPYHTPPLPGLLQPYSTTHTPLPYPPLPYKRKKD